MTREVMWSLHLSYNEFLEHNAEHNTYRTRIIYSV